MERDKKMKLNMSRSTQQTRQNAVTRIRTWVTAATTQGPNH